MQHRPPEPASRRSQARHDRQSCPFFRGRHLTDLRSGGVVHPVCGGRRNGTCQVSTEPPDGWAVRVKSPPSSRARSAMFLGPRPPNTSAGTPSPSSDTVRVTSSATLTTTRIVLAPGVAGDVRQRFSQDRPSRLSAMWTSIVSIGPSNCRRGSTPSRLVASCDLLEASDHGRPPGSQHRNPWRENTAMRNSLIA